MNVTRADRRRLEAIVLDRSAPQKHVWRARIILATADGCGTAEIMRRSGKAKPVVWAWQARFMAEGVDGLLRDKTRKPGKPPLPAATVAKVVALVTGPLPTSAIHHILRNRIYTGEFDWKGHLYKGRHEPLITRELWERVQGVLDGRNTKKLKPGKRTFAFTSLVACGHCGCAMTAEFKTGRLKKGKYVYYHCTGYKGKCDESYVREEVLAQRFSDALAQLRFDDEVLSWIKIGLLQSHVDEQREREEAVKRLQTEYDRLSARLNAMYVDKLDGRIDNRFFEQMSTEWRSEQDRYLREISWHQSAEQSYMEEGVRLLEMAHNATRLFDKQEPEQKRRVLNLVLSNPTWKNGELSVSFRQPFDLLAETTAIVAQSGRDGGANSAGHPSWLGD